MKNELIETGMILGTHGVRGQLRVQPWADSPEVLTGIGYLYIDAMPLRISSAKVHKSNVIVSLEGVDSMEAAIKLKSKIISVKREDIRLEEGAFFIADLIGLNAIDADTGSILGKITDVLTLPGNNVYVINGEREMLVPAVEEFIEETNLEEGFIKLRLIEGL